MDTYADGYGKWYARIGHDSVRELPFTTQVNGTMTEIIGYCYSATGVTRTDVSNDWYPVKITEYITSEFSTLEAWLASEYGQFLYEGCGVSAVVPLATATQRLADNGINITVH